MASAIAANRLRKELLKLQQDPPPGIIAEPKESDILVWFYALCGPSETPFEKGIYVGKLKFPSDYPMKAPDIYMLTPSGRFDINKKLCLSMSSFHPESWSPTWSVSSIIQGIQSFMSSDEVTTGGMIATDTERRRLADESAAYNKTNYIHLFDGSIGDAFAIADRARQEAETKAVTAAAAKMNLSSRQRAVDSKPPTQGLGAPNGNGDKEVSDALPSTEEQEKRRKKNAKKRTKLKAKQAATANVAPAS
ncbi:hypothetical protein MPSEU_000993300 [Mayamaea pseudoterrestris]|nr:hypothetical protein MPSEU_000993300 [Mayamaea pseudoterrestris]